MPEEPARQHSANIEIFARQRVDGWDAWGNEIEESPVVGEESPALDTKEICHTAPIFGHKFYGEK
jgi:N6-adenosine-specific RNA methylase IME4